MAGEKPAVADQERGLAVAKAKAERRSLVKWGERGVELQDLDQALTFAQLLIDEGAVPPGVKAGGVVVSVQKGAEMRCEAFPTGVPVLQAIQLIPSINGRPFIMGDLAKTVVQASSQLVPGSFREWFEGDALTEGWTAICETQRVGEQEPRRTTFTWAEAQRAKLASKDGPWKLYPQRQMRYRALGFHVRDYWPDLMFGCRTYEEGRDIPDEPTVRDVSPPKEPDPLFEARRAAQSEPAIDDAEVIGPEPAYDPNLGRVVTISEMLKSPRPDPEPASRGAVDEAGAPVEPEPAAASTQPDLFGPMGNPSIACKVSKGCRLGDGHVPPCEVESLR